MLSMTGAMRKVFRITAKEDKGAVCYAASRMGADSVAGIIYGNGYTPIIQTMAYKDVPMDEIELVTYL